MLRLFSFARSPNVDWDAELLAAAEAGDTRRIKVALRAALPSMPCRPTRDLPLHRSARFGRTAAMKLLLLHADVDVNTLNRVGDTALSLAPPHCDGAAVVERRRSGGARRVV